MKRTKASKGSEQAQAQALVEVIKLLEPARRKMTSALTRAMKQHDLNHLFAMLAALVEIQDMASVAGERDLVALLYTPIMLCYMRAAGYEPEHARRELRRLHGILPPPNAPSSSSVQ